MASENRKSASPNYKGRQPASVTSSEAAQASSKKADTRCELLLRQALWKAGFRYRKNVPNLPGRPDVVFPGSKVAIFSDGDFWHGRNWEARREKLAKGTNPDYWIAKIQRNMERDRANTERLQEMGWAVLRVWESEIHKDLPGVLRRISDLLRERGYPMPEGT